MRKNIIFGFVISLIIFQTVGCASVQKDMTTFWDNLKATLSDKEGGSRGDAVQKYGYRGKHDEIFTEQPVVSPAVSKPGDSVRYESQYAVLSPQIDKRFVVSEIIVLTGGGDTTVLAKRKSEKLQGMHISTLQFDIPKDLDPGTYKIISTISSEGLKKTVQGEFVVRR